MILFFKSEKHNLKIFGKHRLFTSERINYFIKTAI